MLNQMNINQYGYKIYDEYLDRYYQNMITYSNNKGLIIRYYHIKVNESYNFDQETSIQTDYKNFKYDLYDFVPISDGQSPTSQSYFDPTAQGTSYSVTYTFTLMTIKEPLPGDMFHYYDLSGKNEIDKTEIFRVKSVNYIRSMNNKYYIYQIDTELAPFKMDTLKYIEENQILNHYYWDNEMNKYINEKQYPYYLFLKNNRENLLNIINDNYNSTKSIFENCKINSLFKIISDKKLFSNKILSQDYNYQNYSFKDFFKYFGYLYSGQNIDPVEENEKFPEIGETLNNLINNIKSDNDNNDEYFNDINCDQNNSDFNIFKIDKKEEGKIFTDRIHLYDNFDLYNKLFKILFSYYMILKDPSDKDFFKDDKIINNENNENEENKENSIYYNINGAVNGYEDITEGKDKKNYDAGGYISYQSGIQKY